MIGKLALAITRPVHVIWARSIINAYLNEFSEGTLCPVGVNIMQMTVATEARDLHAPVLLDVNQVTHARCVSRFLKGCVTDPARIAACLFSFIKMEDDIAKLLNSSPKDKESLRNLLSEYFYNGGDSDDNDSDNFEDMDSDDDAEPGPRTDCHLSSRVADYCEAELCADSKEEYEKAEKFRYVTHVFTGCGLSTV